MTLEWCILGNDRQRGEVTTMADIIIPPGKGRIVSCPDCNGVPGRDCLECHGNGRYIRRGCPLCADSSLGLRKRHRRPRRHGLPPWLRLPVDSR
jgi:hypothetical protein